MKYLCLVYAEERKIDVLPEEEKHKFTQACAACAKQLEQDGYLLVADALQPVRTARTVRVREGKVLLTDGPFAETKEQLGGFCLIEAENLEEAIRVAASQPPALLGCVEVRPLRKYAPRGEPLSKPPLPRRQGSEGQSSKPNMEAPMRYLCLIYSEEKKMEALPGAELDRMIQECMAYSRELEANGRFLAGEPLQSVQTATSVRVRAGKPVITDGPFAETKEQLGGFYMIEARDLNEAVRTASRMPQARFGTIEVRPVAEHPKE